MNNNPPVLMIGQLPPPMTGQAFAFFNLVDNYSPCIVLEIKLEGLGKFKKIVYSIILYFRILWYFITKKFDIVYFCGSGSIFGSFKDLLIVTLCKLFNKKSINHIHGADVGLIIVSNNIQSKYYRFFYRKIDTIIVLHPSMIGDFDVLATKVVAVENFYDPILEKLSLSKPSQEKTTFSYFSNLMHSKGILLVLEAFDKLSVNYPSIRLNIAGGVIGEENFDKETLELELSKYLESNSQIKYFGTLSGDVKRDFLWQSDVFVLPTSYPREGIPISILEAMRAGNLIITTDHNYLRHLVDAGRGFLCEKNDVESLYTLIERSLLNEQERITIQNSNIMIAKEKYTLANHLSSISDVIVNV